MEQTTNRTLLNYHRQNQELKGTVVGDIYLRDKIKRYNEANRIQTNIIIDTLVKLEKEYFVHDDKGNIVYEGEGRDRRPKSIFGMEPEEYTKRREAYLNIPAEVKSKF